MARKSAHWRKESPERNKSRKKRETALIPVCGAVVVAGVLLTVTVTDRDLNLDDSKQEQVTVTVNTDREREPVETITLTECKVNDQVPPTCPHKQGESL